MGTTYNPDITVPSPRGTTRIGISSTTNATPIEVTTAVNHGYSTGDQVQVEFPQDANAEGFWTITVTAVNKFTLNGSTGSGAGGAQGIVENFTLLPNPTIPSDGDLVDATNANTPVEDALNKASAYLQRGVGRYRVHDIYTIAVNDDTFAAWSATTVPNTSVWTALQNSPVFGFATPVPVVSANMQATDRFIVTSSTTYINAAANVVGLGLGIAWNGGAMTQIPGCEVQVVANSQGGLWLCCVVEGASMVGGTFDMGWMGIAAANSPVTLNGGYNMMIQHMRYNG